MVGCISKNLQNEKIGRVIDELKQEKEKFTIREAIRIKKLGTIYKQKEWVIKNKPTCDFSHYQYTTCCTASLTFIGFLKT